MPVLLCLVVFAGLLAMVEAGFRRSGVSAMGGILLSRHRLCGCGLWRRAAGIFGDVAGAGLCVLGAGLILLAPPRGIDQIGTGRSDDGTG